MHELLKANLANLDVDVEQAHISALVKYVNLIEKWRRIGNLVGPGSEENLLQDHIPDCLSIVPHIEGQRIVDVGSGAGLPGAVIAIMRPDCKVTLVESHQRKCRFLRQVAIELSLDNLSVVCQRIESWRPDASIDCVVCRGYSSLQKFFDDTKRLHQMGCVLLAMKAGPSDKELAGADFGRARTQSIPLSVPHWEHRHLVKIYW